MMINRYEIISFSQAVRDSTGGNSKVQRKEYQTEGEIPVIDQGQDFIAGYTNASNAYHGQLPVVLFGDHTRIFKYVDFPFALGADGVKVLEPLDGFNASFLHYYFMSIRLPNAGYSRHFKFLKEISVPKPSLTEQHRIVDILSRAEKIVRLRREAQKKAAEVIPALFLDMFGDPVINPKGWPVLRFEEVVAEFRYGTNQKCHDQQSDGGVPVLRIPNIIAGQINWHDLKYGLLSEREKAKADLRTGDVLFVRTNGNPRYIGRCAAFNENRRASYASYLIRARLTERALSTFITNHFNHERYRPLIVRAGRTTAGNFNLSTEGLGALDVILPPISLQRAFADQVTRIEAVARALDGAAAKAEVMAAALSAEVFDQPC